MSLRDIWLRAQGSDLYLALGVCVLATVLFSLSVPRFMAALAKAPGNVTWRAIQEKRAIDRDGLAGLIKSRQQAAAWVGDGKLRSDLALTRLMLWEGRAGGGPGAAAELDMAISDLRDSLTRAPANPHAWARLALARKLSGRSDADASRALAMSFLTGPREPELIESRLRLTFQLWSSISEQDRRLADGHIRFGFLIKPRLVVFLATDFKAEAIVRAALAAAPRQLERFEKITRPRRG